MVGAESSDLLAVYLPEWLWPDISRLLPARRTTDSGWNSVMWVDGRGRITLGVGTYGNDIQSVRWSTIKSWPTSLAL